MNNETQNNPEPRVLICAPIGGQKQYSINEWFQWIANQSHKNYDIAISTNGRRQVDLWVKLKKVEIVDVHGQTKRIKILPLADSDDLTVIQKITYSREKLRRFAVTEKYDYIFFLDTDTIPANRDAISQLMKHKQKAISGLYFYKNSKVPVVLDKETHTNLSVEKAERLVREGKIVECDGFGFGVLLLARSAFEKCAFDYDLFGEDRTDDFGYGHVLTQANITLWCDPYVLCIHLDDPDKKVSGIAMPITVTKDSNREESLLPRKDGEDTNRFGEALK